MSSPFVRRRSVALLATAGLCLSGLGVAGANAAGTPFTAPGALPGNDLKITPTGPQPFTAAATGLADVDTRGKVAPSASQRSAVPRGATVRWNRYGTPASVSKTSGYLSSRSGGSASKAAKAWLRGNAALFGLTRAEIDNLEVVNDTRLTDSKAHAVLFRQKYGDRPAAFDGMVTVGLAPGNRVTYVSSSLSRDTTAPPAATLAPVQAWTRAATQLKSAGVDVTTTGIGAPRELDDGSDWMVFAVDGFAQLQRARLRALALPGGGVRPVFEANVVDSKGGKAVAYTSFVDAVSGNLLIRHNKVDNLAGGMPKMTDTAQPFQGEFTATECGPTTPDHTIDVDEATKTITAAASATTATNDIVINLRFNGAIVASNDTGTSPEAVTYSVPPGGAGAYAAEVCPFDSPTVPFVGPGTYVGSIAASEQETPGGETIPYPPIWKDFVANPPLRFGPGTTDNRTKACWVPEEGADCDQVLNNLAARAPWDVSQRTNLPTFTTLGNAAVTAEAWTSPLTPGALQQRPVSANRHYGFDNPGQDFTDAWNNEKCNPANLVPGGNDILASVANLFAGHNRIHDFSYFLGFTEANYNLQDFNFGLTQPGPFPGREGDPEIGNVQAGAISGGAPSYLGRDNANQITLQDGIPGVTNQYLFQPIAGAFYAPCVDGDFDAPIYGHEYTHAISNRMVAGPDAGLSGFQAGSMGESWSDQVALEYLFEHDYDIGAESPWVEGAYATGNKELGIRNYALDRNPLQFGDIGYDVTGPEVHADGEVWSAIMFDVRRQLVAKYNDRFPESNKRLQLRCSMGATGQQPPAPPLPADQCPGGRRWIQLMFDSFLLQQSATSMVTARDAYLAADRMRFGGANQAVIWEGFASDGLGENARTDGTEDDEPKPGYKSPLGPEGTLRLSARGFMGEDSAKITGKLYVGKYEARVTPIADTDPSTKRPATVKMVPGKYDFVFQADGYGLFRFRERIRAGETNARQVHLSFNSASSKNGAAVDGSSDGVNQNKLLDDTEATNWAGLAGVNVDTPGAHPFVNVDLAGNRQLVRSVRVSALLRPANPDQDEESDMPDDESGSRFTALRQFAIEVCTERGTSNCSSTQPSDAPGSPYTRIFTSEPDAFNGVQPRPLAPTLTFDRFDVEDTPATHVRLVALENQCTGQAQFAGEQDNDPLNATDCKTASDRGQSVRASELEVFSYDATTRPPGDPLVAMTMTGDLVAQPGDTVKYELDYRNLGPKTSSDAKITIEELPVGLSFRDGSGLVAWDPANRRILWRLGNVRVNRPDTVTLTAKVRRNAEPGVRVITAQFTGKKTYSPPAAAITVVGPESALP